MIANRGAREGKEGIDRWRETAKYFMINLASVHSQVKALQKKRIKLKGQIDEGHTIAIAQTV